MAERAVGVRKRLKIGQIAGCSAVASRVELDALLNLLRDALRGLAVRGCEGGVVAECAAAARERSVVVRARESRIDGHLLYALAKQTPKISGVTIIRSVVSPQIHSANVGKRLLWNTIFDYLCISINLKTDLR